MSHQKHPNSQHTHPTLPPVPKNRTNEHHTEKHVEPTKNLTQHPITHTTTQSHPSTVTKEHGEKNVHPSTPSQSNNRKGNPNSNQNSNGNTKQQSQKQQKQQRWAFTRPNTNNSNVSNNTTIVQSGSTQPQYPLGYPMTSGQYQMPLQQPYQQQQYQQQQPIQVQSQQPQVIQIQPPMQTTPPQTIVPSVSYIQSQPIPTPSQSVQINLPMVIQEDPKIILQTPQLAEHYKPTNTYGVFYRIPTNEELQAPQNLTSDVYTVFGVKYQ